MCLAIWLAMINAARGSGIGMLKPFEVLFAVYGSWMISKSWLCTFLYSIMYAAMFMIGTGELHQIFIPIYPNWRFWEIILPIAWTLIFFIPLYLRKKI